MVDPHEPASAPANRRELVSDVILGGATASSPSVRRHAELCGETLARHRRDLEELHYVISHDLAEPLRKIQGFVGLLTRRYAGRLDADADEYLGFILDATERMHQIIGDLLKLSRVTTRGAPFAPVAVEELVTEAVAAIGDRFPDRSIELQIAGALPVVQGDRRQLLDLFVNVVDNAVKFHDQGVVGLRVRAQRLPAGWQVTIQDDGIGIEESYRERIFGVFQRLHTRDEYPGNGIGLALCRRIIERHGGCIWVDSAPDRGSMFHLVLPERTGDPQGGE